jgi:N-acetylglucosamine kinase-like BadF-type ATPase
MSLFAGIDGGQSSTVAAIGDASASIGYGSGPPADLVGEARDADRQRAALEAALDAACDAAHVARDVRFEALVAGISGFDAGISRTPDLAHRATHVRIVHDTEIAHAGALAGAAGIVVIAGTGSVALGNEAPGSPFVRAGGWGYFFGDEGSAVWIARTALRRAMARADRDEPSKLGDLALASFGAFGLRDVQHAFAHGEIGRPTLAAFASDVLLAAADGDADARDVRAAAALELADCVATVDRRLGPTSFRLVSYAGGLFRDEAFVDAFGAALTEVVPHADLVAPVGDPASGALLLARCFI